MPAWNVPPAKRPRQCEAFDRFVPGKAKRLEFRHLTAVLIAGGLLLAGCGGGSDDTMSADNMAAMEAADAAATAAANTATLALDNKSDTDAVKGRRGPDFSC